MDEETRKLIMNAGYELKDEYVKLANEAKEKNDAIHALAYIEAQMAIQKYQIAILTLYSENKI